MMGPRSLWNGACLLVLATTILVSAEPVFTRDLQRAAVLAARLGYQTDNVFDGTDEWESLTYYRSEPDALLLARHEGWCIVAFQATADATLLLDDFYQLIEPGVKEFCTLDDPTACCKTRTGNHRAYYTDYVDEFHADLDDCVKNYCQDPENCVVVSGLSQGASLAAMAGVILRKYDPWVIQYGLIPSLYPDCNHYNPERMIVFVNSGICPLLWWRWLVYDFLWPIRSRGEIIKGYVYVVGEDSSGYVSLGLDAQPFDRPLGMTIMGFAGHEYKGEARNFCGFDGYVQRMEKTYDLYNSRSPDSPSFPVSTSGYSTGALCTQWFECDSGYCEENPRGKFYPGSCY